MRGAVAQARGALQGGSGLEEVFGCFHHCRPNSGRGRGLEQPALAGVESWEWSLSAPALLETLALSSG